MDVNHQKLWLSDKIPSIDVNHLKDKLSGTTPKKIWITLTRLRETNNMAKIK